MTSTRNGPDSTGSAVYVRYLVDDVQAAVDLYTAHLAFATSSAFHPAFAEVRRGNLRLLLSGPVSSAARTMPDGRVPHPGGWNRIHLHVPDIDAEVNRLRARGVVSRSTVIGGPGGRSSWTTRPITRSSCSSQPAPECAAPRENPTTRG